MAVLSAVFRNVNSVPACFASCLHNYHPICCASWTQKWTLAQRETEEQLSYLLKAVWVQLGLVYYLYCHLCREENKRVKLKPQQRSSERGHKYRKHLNVSVDVDEHELGESASTWAFPAVGSHGITNPPQFLTHLLDITWLPLCYNRYCLNTNRCSDMLHIIKSRECGGHWFLLCARMQP